MTQPTVFELNDARLRWVAGDKVVESIGMALVESDGAVIFGDGAVVQSRLQPTHISSEYWHRLDTQPIKARAGAIQHHADLVYAQLMELKGSAPSEAPVDIIVPSSMSESQLSMLLGIAQHAKLEIGRVVDRAVLETAAVSEDAESVIHLEMTLHQCVVSRVVKHDGYWEVQEIKPVSGSGYLDFLEFWSRGAAELFVKETRFDPLHDAQSEQTLIDLLNKSFDAGSLTRGLTMELSGRRLEVTSAKIEQWGIAPLGRIAKAVDELVLGEGSGAMQNSLAHQKFCSGLVSEIPGMRGTISEFDKVHTRHQWIDEMLEPAVDGGVHVTNILARKKGQTAHKSNGANNSMDVGDSSATEVLVDPTHLLVGTHALQLSDTNILTVQGGELSLEPAERSVDQHGVQACLLRGSQTGYEITGQLDGVLLNGQNALPGALHLGDKLTIDGMDALLIRVT
ncbi:MAG: hypothetical protein HOM55_10465 [Proteobacteria bacterium]|jgi:hypothetical protein|nr:hypothetical protein [Pseudomonadota bacterium]